ncbi:hypothetical protein [Streptomyces sp. 900105245]
MVRPTDGLWGITPNAVVSFYDASDRGTQYTDLLDASGTPITSVTTDEMGFLPTFQGPDSVTGMWADAGGSRGAWVQARDAGGGGSGSGPAAFTKLFRVVASATAPADVRAAAAYLCDGVADQVQIQQAITDAQNEGGGLVFLSVGEFHLTAPLQLNGTANEDNPLSVTLMGCGEWATILRPSANVNAVAISNWAQVHLSRLGIVISGSGSGIVSTAVTTTDTRSFWDSSFRNLRINGEFTPSYTGWAMDMSMPFRSVFDNIEIEGVRNGIRLVNEGTIQNGGDCTFTRMFIELVGDNGIAIHVSSPSNNMNQNNWSMVEAGTNGNGCTGILIDGAYGGASQRFWGTNLEQFATLVNVANGESNVFELNYVTCKTGGAGNKAFVCGSNAYNNRFSAMWVNIASNDSLKIIEDGNNTSNAPNVFERIRIENNANGTVTYSKSSSTVLRDIVAFNTGNAMPAGLLQYPLTRVNDATTRPDDHGLLTWTQDPATLRSGGDAATAGVVYLSKVKIVNRATVVSNILVGLVNTPTGLTAGQCVVGLYDSSGNRLAVSADQAAAWATAGLKTAAITPQTLAVGSYYVAILANFSGTAPQFATGAGHGQGALLNAGLTVAASRFLNTAAGNTALPATITLGSATQQSGSRWAALS